MLTTTAAYQMLSTDMTRSLARMAKEPSVAQQSAYYLENITGVQSVDDLLADDRLYSYVMKAFGLGEMTYAKAFMRKVLEEGIDKKDSFANSLADGRYREFAEAFNFARYGSATTAFDRTQQGTVDRFVRQAMEEDAGRRNEGVRLALYFERKVGNIRGAYDVLADPALFKVVQVATGMPAAMSAANIDKQAALISERIDFDELKDREKLQAFLTRFTSLWELEKGPAASVVPAVLTGQPLEMGVRPDLLYSLQNLKRGGI